MSKSWLSYLLVLSIALQSFFAVANLQQPHQIDVEHIKVEHSHDSDSKSSSSHAGQNTAAEHNEDDCHHCGHCHGSHSQWASTAYRFNIGHADAANLFSYRQLIESGLPEHPLRPPMA